VDRGYDERGRSIKVQRQCNCYAREGDYLCGSHQHQRARRKIVVRFDLTDPHRPVNWSHWPCVLNARDQRVPRHGPDQVYVGRGSKWGNPFKIGRDGTRNEVVAKYAAWIERQPELMAALPELVGKHLVCWCAPERCHADVLLELLDDANRQFNEARFAAAAERGALLSEEPQS
jgi:hypothetical protein